MNLIGRLFGPRSRPRPTPSPADVAAVDVDRMIATAFERGDRRSEPEVVTALLVGAELTAERHHDPALRLRAAAAAVAVATGLSPSSATTKRCPFRRVRGTGGQAGARAALTGGAGSTSRSRTSPGVTWHAVPDGQSPP